SIDEHAEAPILTRRSVIAFADHYVPDRSERCSPLVSPLFGELEGLPPTLIQTADLDPIRDDGIRYAEALRAAGVEVRHTNYLGVPHGFASIPGATLVWRQHQSEIIVEMRRHLHPPVGPDPARGAGETGPRARRRRFLDRKSVV